MSRTVLCYGDSNTYGYDPRSFLGDRYAKDIRWTGILDGTSDWSVTCCGQNGREIPTQPRQWEEVRELLRQAGPDVFAVMLGSNDLLCRPALPPNMWPPGWRPFSPLWPIPGPCLSPRRLWCRAPG